jgi:Mg-chelatase subunit ChlD
MHLMHGWILSMFNPSGSTNAASALTMALDIRRNELSVVFVSDGEFSVPAAKKAVEDGQAKRRELGLSPATIMVWGAGSSAKSQESLKQVAKLGRGGFWVHGERRSGPW